MDEFFETRMTMIAALVGGVFHPSQFPHLEAQLGLPVPIEAERGRAEREVDGWFASEE